MPDKCLNCKTFFKECNRPHKCARDFLSFKFRNEPGHGTGEALMLDRTSFTSANAALLLPRIKAAAAPVPLHRNVRRD